MEKNNVDLMKQSAASGILIGIGVVINALSENRYIGAMLFSFALLTIIQQGIPLYTGRIGFIKDYKITELFIVLIFNLIGSVIPVLMTAVCKKDFYGVVHKISEVKFSHNYLQMFFLGMLCGVLMLVAVYTKVQIITVFCIMIFILSGFEHCVADFPFLVVNFSLENLLKFVCIVLGNSAGAIGVYWLLAPKKKFSV